MFCFLGLFGGKCAKTCFFIQWKEHQDIMRSSDVPFHILNCAPDLVFFLPHKPAHGGNVAPPGLADSAPLPARLQTSGTLSAEGSSETTHKKMFVWVPDHEACNGVQDVHLCSCYCNFPFSGQRNADTATPRAAFWQSKQHAFLHSLSLSVQTGSFGRLMVASSAATLPL